MQTNKAVVSSLIGSDWGSLFSLKPFDSRIAVKKSAPPAAIVLSFNFSAQALKSSLVCASPMEMVRVGIDCGSLRDMIFIKSEGPSSSITFADLAGCSGSLAKSVLSSGTLLIK